MNNYTKYNKTKYEKRIRENLCTRCGKVPPVENKKLCDVCRSYHQKYSFDEWRTKGGKNKRQKQLVNWRKNNPAKAKQQMKRYLKKVKREVFEHYGLNCVCCGESELGFLTLDHINNDGKHHRTILNGNFYVKMRKQNFPSGLQTLCWNCNEGKRIYGVCPHKQKPSYS